jgi:hypothetical protein
MEIVTGFLSWRDVKAKKEALDSAMGRNVEQARATAQRNIDAYVAGDRSAESPVEARSDSERIGRHGDTR